MIYVMSYGPEYEYEVSASCLTALLPDFIFIYFTILVTISDIVASRGEVITE